jgi:hypothetical protein
MSQAAHRPKLFSPEYNADEITPTPPRNPHESLEPGVGKISRTAGAHSTGSD